MVAPESAARVRAFVLVALPAAARDGLVHCVGLEAPTSAAASEPRVCDQRAPSPRVHIYSLPAALRLPRDQWRMKAALQKRLAASPYNERDPKCADFFYVANSGGKPSDDKAVRLFRHIASRWPFWNQSVAEGRARHVAYLPCDHGPSDCLYDHPLSLAKTSLNRVHANPVDPRRQVAFLVLNGLEDFIEIRPPRTRMGAVSAQGENAIGVGRGRVRPSEGEARLKVKETGQGAHASCRCCFRPGLDIRLPTPHNHLCGPLCGYNLTQLRQASPWALPPAERAKVIAAPRPVKFFWAGSSRHAGDARAELIEHHANRDGWRVVDLGGRRPKPVRRVARNADGTVKRTPQGRPVFVVEVPKGPSAPKEPRPVMSQEMLRADFCGSPPGWDGGDSDRYLPAVLFGCVPVFFSTKEVRPLEELEDLRWENCSVRVDVKDVVRLHTILEEIPKPRVLEMRAALEHVWQRLLYTSYSPTFFVGSAFHRSSRVSYLGEDGARDAFEGLMRVLAQRAQRWRLEDAARGLTGQGSMSTL